MKIAGEKNTVRDDKCNPRVLIVGAGLALVAIPVLVGFGLFARWRLKKMMAEMQAQAQASQDRPPPGVIDVEYRVIDDRR